jgi:hypothetical protein
MIVLAYGFVRAKYELELVLGRWIALFWGSYIIFNLKEDSRLY